MAGRCNGATHVCVDEFARARSTRGGEFWSGAFASFTNEAGFASGESGVITNFETSDQVFDRGGGASPLC